MVAYLPPLFPKVFDIWTSKTTLTPMLRPLVIIVLLSAIVAFFGKDRKFGFWGYFFCSLILTPLVGILLVAASDRRVVTHVVR